MQRIVISGSIDGVRHVLLDGDEVGCLITVPHGETFADGRLAAKLAYGVPRPAWASAARACDVVKERLHKLALEESA